MLNVSVNSFTVQRLILEDNPERKADIMQAYEARLLVLKPKHEVVSNPDRAD